MSKIAIGTKFYIKNRGYELRELTVSKVGNKYFSCDNNDRVKYEIDTLKMVTEYGIPIHLFRSTQAYEDSVKIERYSYTLKYKVGFDTLTLDQLERIVAIVNEPKTTQND